jgi:hypothetical protein
MLCQTYYLSGLHTFMLRQHIKWSGLVCRRFGVPLKCNVTRHPLDGGEFMQHNPFSKLFGVLCGSFAYYMMTNTCKGVPGNRYSNKQRRFVHRDYTVG